ncbi:hypothetical protein [Vibrio palustris]|uniref:Uncharacterized protein n=1 Tax=Vibrio palustris TaxID=1918946 RepID=A0A1R4B1Z9_9VIBR|nr:hypothetical protein [Vibrio palustris]SJL82940.1 hypothetical protein VPAL9027_00882 [Vibrio palustris]
MRHLSSHYRVMLTLIVAFMLILASMRSLDERTHVMIDQALVTTASSYALARTLDAAISTLKSSEVSAGVVSIDVGQMLNPVSDLIDKFSDIMVLAFTSLSLQKVWLVMLSSLPANTIFVVVGVLLIVSLWLPKHLQGQQWLWKMFAFLAIGRFIVLLSVLSTLLVDHWFLDKQIQQHQVSVAKVSQASPTAELQNTASLKTDDSFLGMIERIKNQWGSLADNVQKRKQQLFEFAQKTEDSVIDMLTLMALYLLKSLILPLLFLGLFYLWLRRVLAVPVTLAR